MSTFFIDGRYSSEGCYFDKLKSRPSNLGLCMNVNASPD